MKALFRPHSAMVTTFVTVILIASGCNKYTESGQTVGQKLDSAIDNTNARIVAAGDKVGNAVFSKVDQVGTIVDDSAITASIKADLLKDPGLSALGIEVNTVKGEVTLKGDVSTDVRKQRAEGIASHIVGVTKVINQLKVSSS